MSATLATFVQISDLHIGHRFEGHGPDRLCPEIPGPALFLAAAEGLIGHDNVALDALDDFVRQLRNEARQNGEPTPIVITTGDLTQDGHLAQLIVADQFIGGRLPVNFGRLGLRDPMWRDLAIPGNHDHWSGPNELRPVLPPRNVPKGSSSIEVARELNGLAPKHIPLNGGRFIEFIRIDTDADVGSHSDDRFWARGEFTSELRALAGLAPRDSSSFRVLLMHHSPSHSPGNRKRMLEINPSSRAELDLFLEKHEISLILTGHVHTPLVDLYTTANQQWAAVEARCGATTARDRLPKRLGATKQLHANAVMVHRVIDNGSHFLWETRTYPRTVGDGFGSPIQLNTTAQANRWNGRAIVWTDYAGAGVVDPSRLSISFVRF